LKPERGRFFTDEESAPGTVKPLVVITHQTWQRRFNGAPAAVGATMTLNGVPLTIVGVMAPPFDVPGAPGAGDFISGGLFLPAAQCPAPRGLYAAGPVMLGVARLAEGISVARANADLEVIHSRLAAEESRAVAGQGASGFVALGGRTLGAVAAQEAVV